MTKLEYTFKNDTLFKMLFVKNPGLLKHLLACLLHIPFESIGQFEIRNPEILPDSLGEKFCRLDISMMVDGRLVDIEIQVYNEGDYRERSLYYWARDYSSALNAGDDYIKLPHELDTYNELLLWLNLFSAETMEEVQKIKDTGVSVMKEAINAYDTITATREFRELERLRDRAGHNEAAALRHAREEGEIRERAKWQTVVASKDAVLADKDAALAKQAALIAELQARLGNQ